MRGEKRANTTRGRESLASMQRRALGCVTIQARSSARIKPTACPELVEGAQAVGKFGENEQAPKGATEKLRHRLRGDGTIFSQGASVEAPTLTLMSRKVPRL